tara:strand:+ start:1200 stop:2591 length:1392 start_codon:yes stop_codon:yes gene_type:complete
LSLNQLRSNLIYVGCSSPERSTLLAELNSKKIRSLVIKNHNLDLNFIADFNLVLFGVTDKNQTDLVKKIVLAGKIVVVILSPHDKKLANLFIKSGARAIFVDPVQIEEITNFFNIYKKEIASKRELQWLRSQIKVSYQSYTTNGDSAPAKRLKNSVVKAGRRFKLISIEGEQGVDIFSVAKELHVKFPGINHPFSAWFPKEIKDAELEKNLIRLEMFKGEEGNILRLGGSIFIDDFSVLSQENQERVFLAVERLGVSSEFRLIISKIIDPQKLIQEKFPNLGKISISNYTIKIPPLRERKKDIPSIVDSILEDYAWQMKEKVRYLTPGALKWICSKKWWGNDSELKIILWKALTYSDSSVLSLENLKVSQVEQNVGDIESYFRTKLATVIPALTDEDGSDFYDHTIKSVEKPLMELVLKESGGNRIKAARLLGMNRNTLSKKLQLLGLVDQVSKISSKRKKGS